MGTVIYSASPLQAMLSTLGTVAFLIGLGVVGVAVAIFRKGQSKGTRIGLSIVGVFLVLAGLVTGVISFISISTGAQTVAARVNDKTIAQESCGQDSNDTCTRYILETNSGDVSYDFVVNSNTYDQAQVNTCYQVTFYKSKSPFNVVADTDSYHRVEAITRIEVADPAACP
jgi:hypothetical protein